MSIVHMFLESVEGRVCSGTPIDRTLVSRRRDAMGILGNEVLLLGDGGERGGVVPRRD